jgi:hypothetical protein
LIQYVQMWSVQYVINLKFYWDLHLLSGTYVKPSVCYTHGAAQFEWAGFQVHQEHMATVPDDSDNGHSSLTTIPLL